jgi:hypothetical protein
MEQEGRNMSELIKREDAIKATWQEPSFTDPYNVLTEVRDRIQALPAASPWHRVEDGLPKEAGEYIVAYHPCWWNDVKTSVTEIGIDTFRGKTSWAKRKFQRVTHWTEKPDPPKEDA